MNVTLHNEERRAAHGIASFVASLTAVFVIPLALCGSFFGSILFGSIRFVDLYLFALTVVSALGVTIYLLLKPEWTPELKGLSRSSILLLGLPVVLSIAFNYLRPEPPSLAVRSLVEIAASLAVLFAALLSPWEDKRFCKFILTAAFACLAIYLLSWNLQGRPIKYAGLSNHKNVVGGLSFSFALLSAICMSFHRHGMIVRVMCMLTIFLAAVSAYAASSRANIVCIAAIASILVFAPAIQVVTEFRSARFAAFCLFVVYGMFLAVPFLYVNAHRVPRFEVVNLTIRDYTGDGFYSGRENFWGEIIDKTLERPILGYGEHYIRVFPDKTMHAHHLGLAKLYHIGVFGFACFMLFWYSVFWQLYSKDHPAVWMCFLLLFVHQSFEVNLTAGGVPVGVSFLVVVGAGIHFVATERKKRLNSRWTNATNLAPSDMLMPGERIQL